MIKCEKFRGSVATWQALQKNEMDGCKLWMKIKGLYKSVVGSETSHIGYVKNFLNLM